MKTGVYPDRTESIFGALNRRDGAIFSRLNVLSLRFAVSRVCLVIAIFFSKAVQAQQCSSLFRSHPLASEVYDREFVVNALESAARERLFYGDELPGFWMKEVSQAKDAASFERIYRLLQSDIEEKRVINRTPWDLSASSRILQVIDQATSNEIRKNIVRPGSDVGRMVFSATAKATYLVAQVLETRGYQTTRMFLEDLGRDGRWVLKIDGGPKESWLSPVIRRALDRSIMSALIFDPVDFYGRPGVGASYAPIGRAVRLRAEFFAQLSEFDRLPLLHELGHADTYVKLHSRRDDQPFAEFHFPKDDALLARILHGYNRGFVLDELPRYYRQIRQIESLQRRNRFTSADEALRAKTMLNGSIKLLHDLSSYSLVVLKYLPGIVNRAVFTVDKDTGIVKAEFKQLLPGDFTFSVFLVRAADPLDTKENTILLNQQLAKLTTFVSFYLEQSNHRPSETRKDGR